VSLLRVEGLAKTFGGVRAVDGLAFALAAGRIQSIIGPNGAGKTTLFNLISGVLTPDAGRIWLGDREVTGQPCCALAGRGLARTFQNLQVFFNMSACENVMVGRHRHLERGPAASARGRSSRGWGSRATPTRPPTACPMARCAGSRSPARSPPSRACCCSTSPPPAATRASAW
jgi:ABC-type branched-subunit amino acid transport system ATPase component